MKPPHIKGQREKEFRRIHNKIRKIDQEIRNLGYIKLEKPIRHGWYKEIIITENVERYKHSKEIKEVYQKIRSFYWGITKEKAQKAWDRDRSQYMLAKDKPTISPKSFRKLSRKAKALCVLFRYKDVKTNRYKKRFYVNLPQGCTEIKYTRAYITHRKRIDPTLMSESDLLYQRLLRSEYYNFSSGGYWNRWNRIDKAIEIKKETRKTKQKLRSFKGKISNNEKEKLWEVN